MGDKQGTRAEIRDTQCWTTARVGIELRLRFLNGALMGLVRGGLMPYAFVSGLDDPSLPVYAGAGIAWESRRVVAHIQYGLERYDFPGRDGIERLEQLSLVRAGVGLRLGG